MVTDRGPPGAEAGANPPPTTAPTEAAGAAIAPTEGVATGEGGRTAARAGRGVGSLGHVKQTTAAQDASKTMRKRGGIGNGFLRYSQKKILQARAQKRAGVRGRPPFRGEPRGAA